MAQAQAVLGAVVGGIFIRFHFGFTQAMNRTSSAHNFILRRMLTLLDEQGWCQYVMCKDRDGEPCFLEDPNAHYFSLVGAYYWVKEKYPAAAKYGEAALLEILKQLNKRNSAEGLIKSPSDIIKDHVVKTDQWKFHLNKYNDAGGRTKMEVVRLLKEAVDD